MMNVIGVSLICSMANADDMKARAIMKHVDAKNHVQTLKENIKMILIGKSGKVRIRNIVSYNKEYERKKFTVMFFQSPSDIKNTGFLMYDYDDPDKDGEQWLYLPALKKVKRIPSADKSSSFMGSDFSYFDMTDRNLEDYDFKLLKEMKIRGHAAWMIEALPRTQRVVKESGYLKTVGIVRKDNYVVVRSVGFMKGNKKKYMDMTKLHKQNGVWVADEITMTTKKGKKMIHKTILKFSDIKLNRPISDAMFTTRRLEKGL